MTEFYNTAAANNRESKTMRTQLIAATGLFLFLLSGCGGTDTQNDPPVTGIDDVSTQPDDSPPTPDDGTTTGAPDDTGGQNGTDTDGDTDAGGGTDTGGSTDTDADTGDTGTDTGTGTDTDGTDMSDTGTDAGTETGGQDAGSSADTDTSTDGGTGTGTDTNGTDTQTDPPVTGNDTGTGGSTDTGTDDEAGTDDTGTGTDTGDTGTDTAGAGTDTQNNPPVTGGVLNSDNYIDVAKFVLQMNIDILATRTFSPTVFLERFPPAPDVRETVLEDANTSFSQESSLTAACSQGGSFTASADGSYGIGGSQDYTYEQCKEDSGTLNGTAGFGQDSPRDSDEIYNLTLSVDNGPDGPGTTVVRSNRTFSGEIGRTYSFDVQEYSRNTERHSFSVSGSGSWITDVEVVGNTSENAFSIIDTATSMNFPGDAGPINLNVRITHLAFSDIDTHVGYPVLSNPVSGNSAPGNIRISAQDGSRVDIAPSDISAVVDVTRTNSTGDSFSESMSWESLR